MTPTEENHCDPAVTVARLSRAVRWVHTDTQTHRNPAMRHPQPRQLGQSSSKGPLGCAGVPDVVRGEGQLEGDLQHLPHCHAELVHLGAQAPRQHGLQLPQQPTPHKYLGRPAAEPRPTVRGASTWLVKAVAGAASISHTPCA